MTIAERRIARVRRVMADRLSSVVIVAEALHRRHNVSAVLRSAESFGVHEVHLITDSFRPSMGAARGSERWLDLHLHADLTSCVASLKARGFRFCIADISDEAHSQHDLPVDTPIALLFGAEMSGVSDTARELADDVVMVPMRGLTQSLNVSVAAALVLERICERRRAHLNGKCDLDPARQAAFVDAWLARERKAQAGMAARLASPKTKKGA
jgi:tRNA (guanosine-2'-O-)-methyltransferase